jgi:hypothetical protein
MTDKDYNSFEHIKNADIDQIIKQRDEDMKLVDNNPNITNKLSDFDVKKFNIDFDVEKAMQEKTRRQKERARLASMEKPEIKKKIYQLSIGEILIGLKDTWFEILDDLLQQRFSLSIFTKGNRLFFIGLTITIIVLIVYLYELLTEDEVPQLDTKVKEVHHIYHLVKADGQQGKEGLSEMTKSAQKNMGTINIGEQQLQSIPIDMTNNLLKKNEI